MASGAIARDSYSTSTKHSDINSDIMDTKSTSLQQNWLAWVFPLTLIAPNVWLAATSDGALVGKIFNLLFPLGAYMWFISITRNLPLTIFLSLPVIAFNGLHIAFPAIFGNGLSGIDAFAFAIANAPDTAIPHGDMWAAAITFMALYVPSLAWAALAIARKSTQSVHLAKRKIAHINSIGRERLSIVAKERQLSVKMVKNLTPDNIQPSKSFP